jgi:DNA-directed RNA polymerase specialized sigma subunit
MMYLATTGASMIMGGATSLLGGAAQAVSGTMQMQSMDFSGSVDQIVQRLKDPKTAQQIAQTTGMEQAQVQQTLSQTAERVEANRDDPTQAAAAAKQGMGELMQKAKSSGALEQKAEELKPAASRGAWIAFGGLLLSLAAAVIGAMVGRRKESVRA